MALISEALSHHSQQRSAKEAAQLLLSILNRTWVGGCEAWFEIVSVVVNVVMVVVMLTAELVLLVVLTCCE